MQRRRTIAAGPSSRTIGPLRQDRGAPAAGHQGVEGVEEVEEHLAVALPGHLMPGQLVVAADPAVARGAVLAQPPKGRSRQPAARECKAQMVGSIAQTKTMRRNEGPIAPALSHGFREQPNPADRSRLSL